MTVNWDAVAAIGAWVLIIGGALGWTLRSTIKNAFTDMVTTLDERYADKEVTEEKFVRVHERLNDHTEQLKALKGPKFS